MELTFVQSRQTAARGFAQKARFAQIIESLHKKSV